MENKNRKQSVGIALDSQQGQQSLLTAINRFVQAVDVMDDTVMIPCRLRDIEIDSDSNIFKEENNNSKAIIPAHNLNGNGDLYHFYAMLHAIRTEISAGPPTEDDNCNGDTVNSNIEQDPIHDSARKTAASFSFHLRGLFGLLHQMTETAKYLSTRYEKEVSSAQTGVSSVSSFKL